MGKFFDSTLDCDYKKFPSQNLWEEAVEVVEALLHEEGEDFSRIGTAEEALATQLLQNQ